MESAFQFTNPVLTELEYLLNPEFNPQKEEKVQIKMNISVKVDENTGNETLVRLKCEIGEKNASCPYWIKAEEQARFRWDDSVEGELLDSLLNQNAPSLLISYLRPIIWQTTMASPYGAYNIPFVNFKKKG